MPLSTHVGALHSVYKVLGPGVGGHIYTRRASLRDFAGVHFNGGLYMYARPRETYTCMYNVQYK